MTFVTIASGSAVKYATCISLVYIAYATFAGAKPESDALKRNHVGLQIPVDAPGAGKKKCVKCEDSGISSKMFFQASGVT